MKVVRVGWRKHGPHENAKALATMNELGQFRGVHELVLPKFDKEYTEASVIEGEDVQREAHRSCFENTDEISQRERGTAVDGRRLDCVMPDALPIDWRRRMV